jgi:hypothetical protein
MTDQIEVFSLEVGDQIKLHGDVYLITDIEDGDNLEYRLVLRDEWGDRRHVEANGTDKMRVLVADRSEI